MRSGIFWIWRGVIKSDEHNPGSHSSTPGVQGLPCLYELSKGKPCTPSVKREKKISYPQKHDRTTPPSTRKAAPVMAEARGLQTKATKLATSSAVAKR